MDSTTRPSGTRCRLRLLSLITRQRKSKLFSALVLSSNLPEGELLRLLLYCVESLGRSASKSLEQKHEIFGKYRKTKCEVFGIYHKIKCEIFRKIDPTGKATRMFYAVPGQLNKNASRYQISSVIEQGKQDRLEELLQDMEDSHVVIFSHHADDPNVGLSLHKDLGRYKMFLNDTGLFITLAFWDKEVTDNVIYQKLMSGKLPADLGYVFENVVAQMLTASGNKLFYHTWPTESGKHNYEVDFLLSHGTKIWPLEVKSSGYKTHASLDAFCEKFANRVSERFLVYTKDYRRDGSTTLLPVVMAMFL